MDRKTGGGVVGTEEWISGWAGGIEVGKEDGKAAGEMGSVEGQVGRWRSG